MFDINSFLSSVFSFFFLCFSAIVLYLFQSKFKFSWFLNELNKRFIQPKIIYNTTPSVSPFQAEKELEQYIDTCKYIEKLPKWVSFSQNKTINISEIAHNIYGIQIGLNYIRLNKKIHLRGCINDAFNIRSLLLADHVPETNLILFSDFTYSSLPTKRNIMAQIQNFLLLSPPQSSHIISFSGHGTRTLQHETICVFNDSLSSIDYIFDTELFDLIEPILSRKLNNRLTFIADSCFSENVLNLQYTYYPNKQLTTVIEQKNLNFRSTNAIIFVISGSTKYQTSADFETELKIAHGALTYTLLRFLFFYRYRPFTYKDFILGINKQLRQNDFQQTSCLSCSQPLNLNQEMLFPP